MVVDAMAQALHQARDDDFALLYYEMIHPSPEAPQWWKFWKVKTYELAWQDWYTNAPEDIQRAVMRRNLRLAHSLMRGH